MICTEVLNLTYKKYNPSLKRDTPNLKIFKLECLTFPNRSTKTFLTQVQLKIKIMKR